MAKFVKLEDGYNHPVMLNVEQVLWYTPVDAKTTIIYLSAMNKDFPVSVVVKGAFEDIEKIIK